METLQQNVSYDLFKNLLLFVSGGVVVAIIAIIKFWTNRLWTLSRNLTRPIYVLGPDDKEEREIKELLGHNKFKIRTGTEDGSQKDALWIIRYQAGIDLFSLIAKRKNPMTPVIIYIPFREGTLPPEVFKQINVDYPYCDIVQSRIRLLNTVYTTLGLVFN